MAATMSVQSRLRARARRPLALASAGVMGLLIAALSAAGAPSATATALLGVVVGVACAFLVLGWVVLLGLPSPRGTTTVLAFGAILLLCAAWLSEPAGSSPWLAAAFAAGLLAEVAHQIARTDGRPRLVESFCGTVTGLALMACGTMIIPLSTTTSGRAGLLLVGLGVAVSTVADVAGQHEVHGAAVAGALGVVAGVVAHQGAVPGVPLWAAASAPALVAVVSTLTRGVTDILPTISRYRSQLAGAAASVLVTGVLGWLTWVVAG